MNRSKKMKTANIQHCFKKRLAVRAEMDCSLKLRSMGQWKAFWENCDQEERLNIQERNAQG